jgi:hypothetical protein
MELVILFQTKKSRYYTNLEVYITNKEIRLGLLLVVIRLQRLILIKSSITLIPVNVKVSELVIMKTVHYVLVYPFHVELLDGDGHSAKNIKNDFTVKKGS